MKYQKKKLAGLEIVEVAGDTEGPVILLFHGFGADAYDLVPLSKDYQNNPQPTWLFPQGPLEVPLMPGYSGRGWFPIDIEALQIAVRDNGFEEVAHAFPEDLRPLTDQIHQLIGELSVPPSKVLLGGFSQGGILAIETILHSPWQLGGAILLSTTLIHTPDWKRLAPQHAGTPFFLSHGTEDPMLPFSQAEALGNLLTNAGWKGSLHSFPGGHEIPHHILISLQNFLHTLLSPSS
ncbi:MAG: Carboxylesterase 2 [Chlamydiae bacterium]|nr:Carboxylesterase 2 [Chlamydiota bacterium]